MAANLFQATVLDKNGQELVQDGQANIYLINKNRVGRAQSDPSGSRLFYWVRKDSQMVMEQIVIDATYATTLQTTLSAQYTAGQNFQATVLALDGDDQTAALQNLSIDDIIWATKDPNDPSTNTILWYLDAYTLNPKEIKIQGDLAAIITATTT